MQDYTKDEYTWADARNKAYRRAMTDFLEQYITAQKEMHCPDGTLRRDTCLRGIEILLAEGVFSDYNDLNREAIKDYGIVIPRAWVNGESGCGG